LQSSTDEVLVIVDAGRALVVRNDRGIKSRLLNLLESISSLAMLARWFKIALDVAYRSELKLLADNQEVDGYKCRLIRIAEEEAKSPSPNEVRNVQRQLELNRLSMLRDRVHGFSILKCSPTWAIRATALGAAACAVEFAGSETDVIATILDEIGGVMVQRGDYGGRAADLADVWTKVAVLGWPRVEDIAPAPAPDPVEKEFV
jgi:hypothetical protein